MQFAGQDVESMSDAEFDKMFKTRVNQLNWAVIAIGALGAWAIFCGPEELVRPVQAVGSVLFIGLLVVLWKWFLPLGVEQKRRQLLRSE